MEWDTSKSETVNSENNFDGCLNHSTILIKSQFRFVRLSVCFTLLAIFVFTTTTNGSTRRGGTSWRSRFGASLGGSRERSAMRTPFLVVPASGNDHRFSATRTRVVSRLD